MQWPEFGKTKLCRDCYKKAIAVRFYAGIRVAVVTRCVKNAYTIIHTFIYQNSSEVRQNFFDLFLQAALILAFSVKLPNSNSVAFRIFVEKETVPLMTVKVT